MKEYEQYKEVIRYYPKCVQVLEFPVRRIESEKCECWFLLSRSNASMEKREASEVLCHEYVQLPTTCRPVCDNCQMLLLKLKCNSRLTLSDEVPIPPEFTAKADKY